MVDVVEKVRQILRAAGLHTVKAYPKFRLPRLVSPMIAVWQNDIRLFPCALSDFLGLRSGQSAYGVETELVVQLDVYAPYSGGSSSCESTAQTALSALTEGLDVCTLKDIQVRPIYYDEETDCYRGTIRLTFGALLYQSES